MFLYFKRREKRGKREAPRPRLLVLRRKTLTVGAALLAAAAIFGAVNAPAAVRASVATRQLPIYCVERDQKVCSIYRKLSDTADDMCLLDIHNRRSGSFSTSFSDFFERIIPAENFAAQFLRVGLFQEAFAKHGGLSENEIFFFAPALAFGGTESIQYVEKGNAVVHQHLLFEMGADHSDDTEPDDMWSQAYEANPHVFELDNGGLMVSFTFSETVDTILPVAPETLYEIEGETISLWALTFVSLTKEENLGFLEYHKALKQLQPYIVETRGDHILVRGLSLAEMEHILAKQ